MEKLSNVYKVVSPLWAMAGAGLGRIGRDVVQMCWVGGEMFINEMYISILT